MQASYTQANATLTGAALCRPYSTASTLAMFLMQLYENAGGTLHM